MSQISGATECSSFQGSQYFLDYYKTSDGVADTSRLIGRCAGGLNFIPSFGGKMAPVHTLFGLIGSWFDIPNTIRDGLTFAESIKDLQGSCLEAPQDMGAKVQKSAEMGLTFAATGCSALLSLHELNVVNLGSAASFVSALTIAGFGYNIFTAVADGVGLFDALSDVQKYRDALEKETIFQDRELLQHKIHISCLRAVKKAVSIAWAVLGLIAVVFAALSLGLSVIPFLILGVSSVYVILNMALYFYGRAVEDGRKARLQQGIIFS